MQTYKGRMWPVGRISIIAGLNREDLFRNTKIIEVFFSYWLQNSIIQQIIPPLPLPSPPKKIIQMK